MSDRPRLVLFGTASAALRARLDALADAAEIVYAADPEAVAFASANQPAVGAFADDEEGRSEVVEAAQLVLRRVRTEITAVHHDVNNPLAIIAGNAQLLLELARVMDLDADLMHPIRDIEEASGRLAEILQRLARLREAL